MIGTWQAPAICGERREEMMVRFSQERRVRLLVLPAWFDEANKLRHFTVETMRRLDEAGIDSFLPDLPGCNESLAPLEWQTLAHWRAAANAAARDVGATHVLAMRTAYLIIPETLPGWTYAALSGADLLRRMVRAQLIAARDTGRAETREALMRKGASEGLVLGGWSLGSALFGELAMAHEVQRDETKAAIDQSELGGAGLWLRSEPSHDPAQARALAERIVSDLGDPQALQA